MVLRPAAARLYYRRGRRRRTRRCTRRLGRGARSPLYVDGCEAWRRVGVSSCTLEAGCSLDVQVLRGVGLSHGFNGRREGDVV